MAGKITFTGVQIRSGGFKRDAKSGNVITTLTLTSNWTKAIREKMGWQELLEIPDSLSSGNLKGELIAVDMELVPTDGKLQKHRFEFPIQTVGTFVAKRVKATEHSTFVELSFKIVSVSEDAAALAAAYLIALGDAKGSLKIEYTEQLQFAQQSETDAPAEGDGA